MISFCIWHSELYLLFLTILYNDKAGIITTISAVTHATTRLTLAQHCLLAKTKPIAHVVIVVLFFFYFSFVFAVLYM